MEPFHILDADGEKLCLEDLEEGWELAGRAPDKALSVFAGVPAATGDRQGWLVPVEEGPIITPNGASGTVNVKAFTAYRSPLSTETQRELVSGFWPGSITFVPTPLPTAGNHNWYLLYARISETDATSESRLVEDPVTEDIAVQTLNTEHKAVVTLVWVQGTIAPTATDPYPSANFPTMPAPASGEAHILIGYVHVFNDATPATVTYSIDKIYNEPDLAKVNPATGAAPVAVVGIGRISGTPGNIRALHDVKTLATTAGTGINNPAGKRPAAFFEASSGGHKLWIPVSLGGSSAIGSAWTILGGTSGAIITPDTTAKIFKNATMDLLNRWFMGRLDISFDGMAWANDQDSTTTDCMFPTSSYSFGLATPPDPVFGCGNTIRKNAYLDSEFVSDGVGSAGDWYTACFFRDPLRASENTDLALVVRRAATGGGYTHGAMYLAAREQTPGALDGKVALITLDISPILAPFNL